MIWLIPCAVAQNIETMLIARFFDGLSGSAFLSVAGGTVGDIFERNELAAPMMLYTASPFVGPEVGPLYASLSMWPLYDSMLISRPRLGGFISQNVSW